MTGFDTSARAGSALGGGALYMNPPVAAAAFVVDEKAQTQALVITDIRASCGSEFCAPPRRVPRWPARPM